MTNKQKHFVRTWRLWYEFGEIIGVDTGHLIHPNTLILFYIRCQVKELGIKEGGGHARFCKDS